VPLALADALERMTDAFVALDHDWRYVYVNARAGELFGRAPRDLVGKHIWTEFPEGVGQPSHRAYEQAMATQRPVVFEEYYAPWDRWFENRCFPSPDGLTVFFSEVSERRRAEAALRDSEARFRAVFEQSPLAIAIRGDGDRIVDSNAAFRALLGYGADELRALTVNDITHPDDRAANDVLAEELRAGKREGFRLEKRYLRKDGRVIEASITVAAARTGKPGASPFYVAMVEDVTERREAERRLRDAQRLEAVGRLAGGVAHDFNNLLAVVLSFADLAIESLPADHPARADVGEIRRAAERGAALTRQLLAFGRKQILQPRRVELNAALAESERMLRRILPPEVALHVVPSPVPVHARVDPGQLQQALLHLVVNARDATPGGGTVMIEPALAEVGEGHPSGAAPGPYATVSVRDRGSGMDDATRARAFDPFFTTKPQGVGTGLGLPMVHGFTAQSGGAVTLESAPGEGTTVTLYLPVAAPEAPAAKAAPALGRAARATPASVLVVEDEAHVRRSIVRILGRQGFRVIEARHGADALLAWDAERGAVDVLVTDLVMPELGGRALVERLRALRPALPVVVVSGYAGDVPNGDEPPIAHARHLEKPFDSAALLAAVEDALADGAS